VAGKPGKRLRRRAFGARESGHLVLEICNIRSAEVEESGHRARRAHAAGRRENVDIYSLQSAQNVDIYSLQSAQNVNIYSVRAG